MRFARLLCILALLALTATTALAQRGKISGVVTDAGTGDTMPGVNVAIVGTTQGAVADVDGFYFINNVRPGTYTLQASFIGFVSATTENVRVSTGLTTEVNFQIREQAVGLAEIVVTSVRPIVQLDVSANVASLNPADFEDLPIAGVSEVLDLQAGIEPGLQIRGGGLGEIAFIVDGLNMRTGRDNEPFTNISYTALEEVQVQTGGFNAEYGNVRAGIVNVTTKEPPRNHYTFDGIFRYAPAQDKSFEALDGSVLDGCDFSNPNSICDSWWVRGATDPEVAFVGTDNWDPYTASQYRPFEGWNAVADRLNNTEGFDVTPQDMLEYFKFTHRKDNVLDVPDFEADFTFGGPLIPGLSEKLGDLRFLFSYRGTQTGYTLWQTRDSYDANTFQGKLISNIKRGMKLTLHGMHATERGLIPDNDATRVSVWKGNLPAYPWFDLYADPVTRITIRGINVFSDGYLGQALIDHTLLGGTFTHTLNANTFYEITLQNLKTKYRHKFPNFRDGSFLCPSSGVGPDGQSCPAGEFVAVLYTDNFGRPNGLGEVTCFGGTSDLNGDGILQPYCAGDEPFGFAGTGGNLITGESTGAHWDKTRDTTDVSVFTGRFDLTSQLNRFLQIKTGAEIIVSDYDVFSQRTSLGLGFFYSEDDWNRSPIQGAAYAQGKLEFKGMIANLGVRLDYFDANSAWWVFDGPYDNAYRSQEEELDATLPTAEPDAQTFLSPRLGVSFPITENSKFYFNYGHFRQMLNPFDVFGVQSTPAGGIDVIGNPTHPMPLTVAYELGYDQNLFDQFLLRVSGFYRDIREQARNVRFEGLGGTVEYTTKKPWNYRDIRGFELTLTKTRGKWIRGFINYTFLQRKEGNFGYSTFFENSFDQRNFLRTDTGYRLTSPIAEPYARANLILITPQSFGPKMGSGNPLGDWRVSLLGEWRTGEKWTWSSLGSFPELQENVRWKNYLNFDLRLSKHINTRFASLQIFVDIDNVFNRRHLYNQAAFIGSDALDFNRYLESLHLPGDIFDDLTTVDADAAYADKDGLPYLWVPGDDQPGDFRHPDTPFQPIVVVPSLGDAEPDMFAWFYDVGAGTYSRWNGSSFEPVPDGELQSMLDEKGYIDMPNARFNTFLNPRRVILGIRVGF